MGQREHYIVGCEIGSNELNVTHTNHIDALEMH